MNNIKRMYAIAFLQGMVFYASIATLYRTTYGISVFDIATIESISYVLMIIFEVPWGWIADKIGYKKTMLVCNFLYFISKLIFWRANGYIPFLIERILLSIVFSGMSGVGDSILYLSDRENSHHTYSVYGTMGTLGMLLSSVIFALWLETEYRLAAFLTAGMYLIAFILTLGMDEVRDEEYESKDMRQIIQATKDVFNNRKLLFFIICSGLFGEVIHLLTVFYNQSKYQMLGITENKIAYLYILMNLMSMASVFSAVVSKYIKDKYFIMILLIWTGISAVVMGMFNEVWVVILSVLNMNIAFSLFTPLAQKIEQESVNSKYRATVISAGAIVADIVAAIVDLIAGKLMSLNLNFGIISCSGFVLMSFLFYIFSLKTQTLSQRCK